MAVFVRLIALNGSGGAFVDVFGATYHREFDVIEDEATTPQGLAFKSFEDNFVSLNTVTFADTSEPLSFPNVHRMGQGGALISFPSQGVVGQWNYVPSPKMLSARSKSATATTIRLTENS